jgi:hypothetical protein
MIKETHGPFQNYSIRQFTYIFFHLQVILPEYLQMSRSRDSVVGIAIRYGLEGPGIESRWGRFSAPIQTGSGAHPASCTMGNGSFPGVKAAGA